MSHKWNGIEFVAPAELRDVTYHYYVDAKETESLEISPGLIPPNVYGNEEIAQELKERIRRDKGPLGSIV